MPSAPKRSRRTREWQSDEEYIADQDEISSWSSQNSVWGDAAASKLINFGFFLGGRLCHDDKIADFGGNDGYSAHNFYLIHKIKPLVVDCEPKRLKHAKEAYGLKTLQAFIEDMHELPDKSIDWGFTSHTLEHTRDTEKAIREIARVVRRGCCFILPLEDMHHAKRNHAHAICFTKMAGWIKLLEGNGWKIVESSDVHEHEVHIFAEPK